MLTPKDWKSLSLVRRKGWSNKDETVIRKIRGEHWRGIAKGKRIIGEYVSIVKNLNKLSIGLAVCVLHAG